MGASLTVFDAAFKASEINAFSGGDCDDEGDEQHYADLDSAYNELVTLISNVEVKLWVVLASALKYLTRKKQNIFSKLSHKVPIAYAEKVVTVCRRLLQAFQTSFAPAISAADAHIRAENVDARVAHIQATGEDDPSLMPSLRQSFIRRARVPTPDLDDQVGDGVEVDDVDFKLTRRENAAGNFLYISQDVCSIFFDLLKASRDDFLFFARTANLVNTDTISVPFIPQSELVLLGFTVYVQTKMILTRIASHMLCLGRSTVDSYLRQVDKRLAQVKLLLDELQGCAGCLQFDNIERQMIKARLSQFSK